MMINGGLIKVVPNLSEMKCTEINDGNNHDKQTHVSFNFTKSSNLTDFMLHCLLQLALIIMIVIR